MAVIFSETQNVTQIWRYTVFVTFARFIFGLSIGDVLQR
jgi:hypothetical protein